MMESMRQIPVGAKAELRLMVTSDVAIDFLGKEEARVLSTPHLIGHLEWTSRNAAKPHLEDGWDTVGTHVDVRHLAATPVGFAVTFHAEVIEVEGNRVRFQVEAYDESEKIAEGFHERFVIEIDRFARRLQKKARTPST
jgi:fluoroacetyl-CoA thioesterase